MSADSSVRLYSDRAFLPDGAPHVAILIPFWGRVEFHTRGPLRTCYDEYAKVGDRHFTMTDLASCDYAVVPAPWSIACSTEKHRERAYELIRQAKALGKTTLIFDLSDEDIQVPSENVLAYRTAINSSTRRCNEHALPAWSEDFVTEYLNGKLPLRRKAPLATVGFCGVAATSARRGIFRFGRSVRRNAISANEMHAGYRIRNAAISTLETSSVVKTSFIKYRGFYADAFLDAPPPAEALLERRQRYLENMVDSDYVLCTRGEGNYSFRIYEALCCGRIPVFVNTDCLLPFDDVVEWGKYCVWVEETDLRDIDKIIAEFHARLSPVDFIDWQIRCRRFWEEWIRPDSFFRKLAERLVRLASRRRVI